MNRMFTSLLCGALALAATAICQAQGPQKVPRVVDERMSYDWYVEQAKLWHIETQKDPTNQDAWINYYRAIRYTAWSADVPDWAAVAERTARVLEEIERAAPSSFAYHYIKWASGGMNGDLYPHLEKAYELRQDYELLSPDMISYHEVYGDREQMKFFSRKWYETRMNSRALFEYSYNVLMSLDSNAIIFTTGDIDTYPLWMLQYAEGIRTDVRVVNVSLAGVPEYRQELMREEGIGGDPALLDWERMAETPYHVCVAEFLESVCKNTKDRPVYFAMTCDPPYLDSIREDLYTVGLANLYSPKRIDNIAILKRNWERFHLDYLDFDFYGSDNGFNRTWLPSLNMNYISPLMLLYEHHHLMGDRDETAELRAMAIKLGSAGGQKEEVEEYLATIDGASRTASTPSTRTSSPSTPSALEKEVDIFPNPASNALTVTMPDASETELEIAGLDGTVLKKITAHEREIRIDIADLPAGNYILHVKTARGEVTKKIQVAR